jgi:hypothetical protein
MADDPLPIARVALARDLRRVLAVPLLLVLIAASTIAGGFLIGGLPGEGLWVAGGLIFGVALVLTAVPLSLRMVVEVGGLRIRWIGGQRRYHLMRGPVTRVTLSGPSAGAIHSRHPILGWSNGPAALRDGEPVDLVRLSRSASVILVPTDRGRLAVAPQSEPALLEALSGAARVQQRLDEVSGRVVAAFPKGIEEAVATPAERAKGGEPEEEEQEPRFLTGIERARLEERLAVAREAALLAAEAERRAQEEAAAAAAASPRQQVRPWVGLWEGPRDRVPSASRIRRRATWTRPPWATDARLNVLATIGWAAVPLLVSGGAWLMAGGVDALSGSSTSTKFLSLALTLGGPAAALGVVATRTWWPRLTGLVAASAVAGLILTGRAYLG